jgi:hypothetical protein
MPSRGPRGEKRPGDVIGAAIVVPKMLVAFPADMGRFGLFLLLLGVVASPARAQPGAFVMSGRCTHFSVGANDMTAGCAARLINANNTRGQTTFLFSLADGAFFSFEGVGTRQIKVSANQVRQPLSDVVFSLGMEGVKANTLRGQGLCAYSNPYAGRAYVDCSISTKQLGVITARFYTDGSAPTEYRP